MEDHLTRRTMVTALGAAAVIVAFSPTAHAWATGDADPEGLHAVPALDGELVVDEASLSAAAEDFGRLVHRYPRAVLRPGSVDDVRKMVRFCRKRGIPVAPRGQGHSTYGQAQVENGLVIEMATLAGIDLDGTTARVGAGARWSELLAVSLPQGLTPPVLTDYLELSVGGTLAVGGFGGASHRFGAQTDTVLELEVVTGAGEHAVCSPTQRTALFHAVLAGQGQCAIVVGATVQLAPAPQTVRHYQLRYPSVTALTADQRLVAADNRFEYLEGQIEAATDGSGDWTYTMEAVAFHHGATAPDDTALIGDLSHTDADIQDIPYLDFADRLAPGVEFLKSIGAWYDPHPWWNGFVPDSAVDSFASAAVADLTPADLGPTGLMLLYPFPTSLLGARLLRVPDEPVVFLFSLLKTATPAPGVPSPEAMVEANRALYEDLRDAGGYQYPVGSIPMSRRDWRRHYGDVWKAFAAAKRRYDPANILVPGPGIFR